MMQTARHNRLLLLLVVVFAVWVVVYGGLSQAPLLLPLFGATLYGLWPLRTLGDRGALWLLFFVAAIIAGMILGPLQQADWANHLSHMAVAALLAFISVIEFRLRASNLLVGLAALGVVMTCGVGMEMAEATVHWNDGFGRYHDTMLDLGADLGGALLGMLIGWQLSEAGLIGRDSRRGAPGA